MPKTLLAVDDSATMRRVLEITFSGEDYRIVTADSAQAALGKMNEEPKIVLIDTVLGSDDGYALSKEIRKRDASATIVLLSSRHNPYDAAKGKDAGADDFMDKPFDTQQMVDKVRKAVQARESGASVPGPTTTYVGVAPAGFPPPAPAPAATPAPAPVAAARPAAAAAPVAAAAPKPTVSRANTLMFGTAEATKVGAVAPATTSKAPVPAAPPAPAAAAQRPVATSLSASPNPPKVSAPVVAASQPTPVAAAAAGTSSTVAGKVNGHLTGKLGDLGLTPDQIAGVLALSREVVEQVVWDIVPELAETLIKEEIARLMKV